MKPRRLAVAFFVACLAPVVADAQDLNLGAEVYRENCLACHGDLSAPGGPVASDPGVMPAYFVGDDYLLSVPPFTLRGSILYGVPGTGMIGIGGAVSDVQLESLIAYIESFEN